MSHQLPTLTRTYQNHSLDSTRWNCYRPRTGDVVISTSLKSGTTWMLEIVGQLIFQGQGEPATGACWIAGAQCFRLV